MLGTSYQQHLQHHRSSVRKCFFQFVGLVMSDFLQPHEVTARTSFQTADMPELGLRDDVDGLPFRVYCLRCGDGKKLYVGVVHRSDLKERLEKHWQADATLFTTTHRCFEICLIRPSVHVRVQPQRLCCSMRSWKNLATVFCWEVGRKRYRRAPLSRDSC